MVRDLRPDVSAAAAPEPSLERVMAIVRRDLMIGPEVPLTADTPLFGGDLDLDSLDALLLVQSLEREFGFKVSPEAFGPAVFQSVAALAEFVRQHRSRP